MCNNVSTIVSEKLITYSFTWSNLLLLFINRNGGFKLAMVWYLVSNWFGFLLFVRLQEKQTQQLNITTTATKLLLRSWEKFIVDLDNDDVLDSGHGFQTFDLVKKPTALKKPQSSVIKEVKLYSFLNYKACAPAIAVIGCFSVLLWMCCA